MKNLKRVSPKHLAALVSSHLEKHGIDVTLVGGACVTIYTHQAYVSYDLDMASDADLRTIRPAMKELGFEQKSSRHFEHSDCRFFIEFVAPPIAVGADPIKHYAKIKTSLGSVRLLTPTDCVRDRLAAYYHWNDHPSLRQAIMVARRHRINWKIVRDWSGREGHTEKYKIFRKKLADASLN